MAKKEGGILARLEFVIILIFFLGFIIWATGRCSRTRADYEAEATRTAELDSLEAHAEALANRPEEPEPAPTPTTSATVDTIGTGPTRIIRERQTPLFVTIDGLNVRRGPGLNYDVIDRLELYTEVNFLNEVTDSLYTITLGDVTPTEPWVKVRTPKGRAGWVFGAGVSYYKKRLPGVE